MMFSLLSRVGSVVLALGATVSAQTIELDNGRVQMIFARAPDVSGTVLALNEMRNLQIPSKPPITMSEGAGSWTVRLMQKNSAATRWLEFSMDGTSVTSAPDVGTLDSLTLEAVVADVASDGMVARWAGDVTMGTETIPFRVTTQWTLAPNQPFADTSIRVQLLGAGNAGSYISQVVYPTTRVTATGTGTDELVLPWLNGVLVTDPTNPAHPFPHNLASGENFFPVHVAGYYDAADPLSNCLSISATDGGDHWKELWVDASQGAERYVQFEMMHLPDDVFDNRDYETPYAVRLGAFPGDWWNVAERARTFLGANVPWYRGPVGSPSHPMPSTMKHAVAEVFLQNGYRGDHMDLLSRQVLDIQRVLGDNVNTVLYGGYAPDEFDFWLLNGGSLPGRPSLRAAVREGQKQFGTIMSPYVNGTAVADYSDPALVPPITDPTQLHLDAVASFTLQENLEPRYYNSPLGPPRSGYPSAGSVWWQEFFVDHVRDILTFTGQKGVYLDFFLTGPSYATDHASPPGGGNWMFRQRIEQLRAIKAPPFEDLGVMIEFVYGRFTEEVHIMHVDPANNLISGGVYEGTPIPKPMENAAVVPFFRAIHDDVKLSRITTTNPSDSGRRAWIEANNVFTFGQIPSITRPLAELIPVFSQRFAFAPFVKFLKNTFSASGGSFAMGTPSVTDFPFTKTFEPQDDTLNVPYLRFLGNTARALRDRSFMTWHNGTVQRLPSVVQLDVTPSDFDGVPGIERKIDDPFVTQSPTYVEELYVPGMFRAPSDLPGPNADSLAFVLANPWVDPLRPATLELDFTFEPSNYMGWTNTTLYSVTRHNPDGTVTPITPGRSGVFQLQAEAGSHTLEPGDITWWTFRLLSP